MGTVVSAKITPGSVVNTDIAAGAGIDASKLEHCTPYLIDWGYDDTDGSIATGARTFFMAPGPGELIHVVAWLCESGTSTDIDLDLKVSGTTALSAQINLLHTTGDQTPVKGTISSGTLAVSDYVTAEIATVTSNTGAQGPRMLVFISHDWYSP
jgi:hypothetical protein